MFSRTLQTSTSIPIASRGQKYIHQKFISKFNQLNNDNLSPNSNKSLSSADINLNSYPKSLLLNMHLKPFSSTTNRNLKEAQINLQKNKTAEANFFKFALEENVTLVCIQDYHESNSRLWGLPLILPFYTSTTINCCIIRLHT